MKSPVDLYRSRNAPTSVAPAYRVRKAPDCGSKRERGSGKPLQSQSAGRVASTRQIPLPAGIDRRGRLTGLSSAKGARWPAGGSGAERGQHPPRDFGGLGFTQRLGDRGVTKFVMFEAHDPVGGKGIRGEAC